MGAGAKVVVIICLEFISAKVGIDGTFVFEMAWLLYIDTSSSPGLVMLAKDGNIISSKIAVGEREHAARVNGMIAEVLTEAGVGFEELNAVCVCNGPGSYTGLRIGLSTAKGLCYALSIPLITHNRLELMLASCNKAVAGADKILTVIPARAAEYFIAAEGENFVISPSHLPQLELEKLIEATPNELKVIGVIPMEFQEFLSSNNVAFKESAQYDVAIWAALGNLRFSESNFVNLAYCEPEYLKFAYISAGSDDKKG